MRKITSVTPETEILHELGRRLAQVRKHQGFSQRVLAERAGIGVATLRRIEGGQDSQLESWIKLLKALDMAHAINGLLPEPFRSPMDEARAVTKRSRQGKSTPSGIVWGDETT